MSPNSGNAYNAFNVNSSGYVNNNNNVYNANGVRPELFKKLVIMVMAIYFEL